MARWSDSQKENKYGRTTRRQIDGVSDRPVFSKGERRDRSRSRSRSRTGAGTGAGAGAAIDVERRGEAREG